MTVAKILSSKSHFVPGKIKVTEWFFEVPKNYSKPTEGNIRLFARSAEKVEKPADPSKDDKKQLPYLLYLQGGPGFGCRPNYGGVYSSLMDKGYRVLLLDQRGTGMSNTITAGLLKTIGSPKDQVEYLKLFRADNIVNDAEAVRKALTADYAPEKKKWSILGQSFGGFCSVTYLSRFPGGLREVFTTGGLPPPIKQPDTLYERLCRRMIDRSHQYYEKFPEDVEQMQQISRHLSTNEVKTFTGGTLSPSRLRALGIVFGMHGGFEAVHNLVLRLSSDLDMFGGFSRPTINEFDAMGSFDDAIIYALLHEPLYLSGHSANWSAERMLKNFPQYATFDGTGKDPIMFTAEMITKSMFKDYSELSELQETGELLAQVSDWPDLYDEEQLARNTVPVYSAQYYDDPYVDLDYATETAKKIQGCKVFITNSMWHNAIGSKTEEVVKELFSMRDDVLD